MKRCLNILPVWPIRTLLVNHFTFIWIWATPDSQNARNVFGGFCLKKLSMVLLTEWAVVKAFHLKILLLRFNDPGKENPSILNVAALHKSPRWWTRNSRSDIPVCIQRRPPQSVDKGQPCTNDSTSTPGRDTDCGEHLLSNYRSRLCVWHMSNLHLYKNASPSLSRLSEPTGDQ